MSNPAQYGLVQTVDVSTKTATPANIAPAATRLKSLLIVAAFINSTSQTITGITDNAKNTWVKVFSNTVNTGQDLELWYSTNTQPTNSINVAWGGVGSNLDMYFREYGGMDPSAAVLDITLNATGSGSSMTTGATSARRSANELLVSCGFSSGGGLTLTAGTNFGNLVQKNSGTSAGKFGLEDQTVASIGTDAGTMSSSGASTYVIGLAAFLIASGKFPTGSNNLRPHAFSPGIAR